MTVLQELRLGEPYPGRANSLLVHIPTWADMVDFGQGKAQMNHGYSRSVVHPDIRLLSSEILAKVHHDNKECTHSSLLLFSGARAAFSCKHYILLLSQAKDQPILAHSIQVYRVDFSTSSLCRDHHARPSGTTLYAVLYPSAARQDARLFWQRAGPGMSSRLAQQCLQYGSAPRLHAMTAPPTTIQSTPADSHPVYEELCFRIAGYFQHRAAQPQVAHQVAASDVFLYASGMAAIYHVHQSILDWRNGESVNAGLVYEPTMRILQTKGPGLRSYNLGTQADLDRLAAQLEQGSEDVRAVQAIWCECPSNPILQTVDLQCLRRLADQHNILVVVDDSVASFANVDLLGVADVVVSSLSKYFSGYADVMAGSAILNPNSRHYAALQRQLSATYENGLFVEDAIRLESNSRDFLTRMARINETTQYLVSQLLPLVMDPASPLMRIFYPSVCTSRPYYERQMRPAWPEGPRPGYGGVFTMEFADVATSAVFFDHLHVYKGLSFGADVCIASPYMQMTGQAGKKQASSSGISETIIRFSVGLEEAEEILQRINGALEAASVVYSQGYSSL
ncbi:hypothetical protein ASPZODRAFT_162394 [Penicilliopsis zonata CBS 506.65]|uniref:Cystathionine gamma-synthase n=1 Tax=Penicilliopsis zonata CBS 506.65 TaxID=1073090 RepID=A0A1L9S4E0_9EURO|nr:hypothetical protein ASPZODRAFT_162394 [Penicilliopsis zonata CBS 506.65]OJJ42031.1 hypothetical protein ASPZODRAFT_162394 [Penicilliopsis zonata CBS 506.65]